MVVQWLCIVSLSANAVLAVILFTPLTEALHSFLDRTDPPEKAQAIVVLSSAFPWKSSAGIPGLSTLMRLEKGVRLYRAGYADKIIVLGGIEIPSANKTIAQAMAERLLLYGIPQNDIIVHDDIRGTWEYYDNLVLLLKKYQKIFDFEHVLFVTSIEQSYRIKRCLQKFLRKPIVVASDPYELYPDWGRRFHLFRRVANEMLVAIPLFHLHKRF